MFIFLLVLFFRLTSQYDKAIAEVNETFNFYMSMLAERKMEVVKELEKLYSTKQVSLSVFGQKVHDSTDKIEQMVAFIEKLVQSASSKDVLMFQASLESKMAHLLSGLPHLDLASTVQLEFISNFQVIVKVVADNQILKYFLIGNSSWCEESVRLHQERVL